MTGELLPPTGVDRAALAFSALSTRCAAELMHLLTPAEQLRLQDAMNRLCDASGTQRLAAIDQLTREVCDGVRWPQPAVHDAATCPFAEIGTQPAALVVDTLTRIANHEPLDAAVTLCHLSPSTRAVIWQQLDRDARAAVLKQLPFVPFVRTARTNGIACGVMRRLDRIETDRRNTRA